MGILEFHFHDSEFRFAPSVTTGDESEEASSPIDKIASSRRASTDESASESTGRGRRAARGVGALVGLTFLVGVGVFARRMISRRRGASEDEMDEMESEPVQESIEIAD